MRFSDRLVRCEACGVEFVYTVREQRKRAEMGLPTDAPAFCKDCRAADVRLAEAAGPVPGLEDAVAETTTGADADAAATRQRPGGGGEQSTKTEVADGSRSERRSKRRRGRGRKGAKDDGESAARQSSSRGSAKSARRGPKRKMPRQTELRIRHVGTVKWFDEDRGYGFIAQDDGEELFVHMSGVLGPSGRALEQGQQVEYEIEHTNRGLQAVDVIQLP
ncbi:MAG: cold-shock protein [Anaerolineae bacterium]